MRKILLICCGVLALFDASYIIHTFWINKKSDPPLQAEQQRKRADKTPHVTPLIEQQQGTDTVIDGVKGISNTSILPQTTHQVFDYVDPQVASVKNINLLEYTILATGDVIPARSVNAALVRRNNFTFPFEKTVGVLKSADVVFINLESPLVEGCQVTTGGMSFCGDPRAIEGLTYAGVSVASIANNHAGNYGVLGIRQTVEMLKKHNIAVTGNGESAIVNVRGKKFGFLGYNSIGSSEEGIAWTDDAKMTKDIQTIKKQVDFVLVAIHWGEEYTSTPSAAQREIAHVAIDAGADLIIGNHPHWVQGIERYKGKHITYAHGNYIFDQMWSQETREGVLGKYVFSDSGLVRVEFIPIVIDDYSEARYATEGEAKKILERMRRSTNEIPTTYTDARKE